MRLASDPLAMLAVGSGTGPVPDGAHGAAGEHQRDSGVTREDGEDRADDDAEHHEPDMEGVPWVCHEEEGSSAIETVVVSNVNGEKFASNKLAT